MSGISESHAAGMGKAQIRNNMIRFAVAQAFGSANSVIVYATGAIVGDMLAPNKALATFPISVFVVGMAACTLPMGTIARRWGHQAHHIPQCGQWEHAYPRESPINKSH